MSDLSSLCALIVDHEDWLLDRVLKYAQELDFTRYASTLREAWRLSIHELSRTLVEAIQRDHGPIELSPDDDYQTDPAAAFGVFEAKRHRERGISLTLFLALMKYYRQAYLDLVTERLPQGADRDAWLLVINRLYDRMELGVYSEWTNHQGDDVLAELQDANRRLTNEKNKYLTLFASGPTPALLLGPDQRVVAINHAAGEVLFGEAVPGGSYYGEVGIGQTLAWLPAEALERAASGDAGQVLALTLETGDGPRDYEVRLAPMLDVSGKFSGTVVSLFDVTERLRAEADAERFARFPRENPNPVLRVSLDGTVEYANGPCEPLLAQWETQVGGRLPATMWAPLADALRSSGEASCHVKCGSRVYLISWTLSTADSQVGGYALDVTRQVEAESALAESEEQFRIAFESASIGKSLAGPDGKLQQVNQAYCDMLGRTREQLLSATMAEITHPDDVEKSREFSRRLLAGEFDKGGFEKRYLRPDGTVVWTSVTSILIRHPDGSPWHIVTDIQDITLQKRAEEAMAASEERLRLALSAANDGVWDYHALTGETYFGPRYYTMLGYEPNEFPASYEAWKSLLHPDDVDRAERLLQRHLSSDQGRPYHSEFRMRSKSGDYVWVLSRGDVVERDASGAAVRMVGTHSDITGRMAYEDEIRRLNRLLATISDVNQMVVRVTERQQVLDEVCKICVERGGYRLATIRLVDSHGRAVTVAARHGHDVGYVDFVTGLIAAGSPYLGPTGAAISSRTRVLVNDVSEVDAAQEWRDETLRRGINSLAALPLLSDGRLLGCLTLYCDEQRRFTDPREVALLEEMAGDVAFALTNIEREEHRRALEDELKATLERYRGLYESLPGGSVVVDCSMTIVESNQMGRDILGAGAEVVEGRNSTDPVWQAIHEDGSPFPGETHPSSVTLRTGESVRGVVMGLFDAGGAQTRWLLVNSEPLRDPDTGEVEFALVNFVDITELKAAQDALNAEERNYRLLFEQMQEGFAYHEVIVDADGRPIDYITLEANDAFCAMTRLPREELIGRPITEVLPGIDPYWIETFGQVALTGVPCRTERWSAELGRWFASVTYSPEAGRFACLVDDITDRKYADAEHVLVSEVLAALNQPRDSRTAIGDVVSAIRRFAGVDAVGIRGRAQEGYPYLATEGFPPGFPVAAGPLFRRTEDGRAVRDADDKALLACICGDVIQGRTDPERSCYTDAGSFWSNAMGEFLATGISEHPSFLLPHCSEAGFESVAIIPLRSGSETVGLLHVADTRPGQITDRLLGALERLAPSIGIALARREAEAALGERELALTNAQRLAKIGNWSYDVGTDRLSWSNEVFRIFGIAPDSGPPSYEEHRRYVHPDDWERFDRAVSAAAREGSGFSLEFRVVHPDGTVRHVAAVVEVEEDGDGGGRRLVGTCQDVTERKEADEHRARLEEQLRAAQRLEAIGSLAAGVAHDFNNLLASISSTADLVEMGAADEGQLVRTVRHVTRIGVDITRNLMAFARPDEPRREEGFLEDVLDGVLQLATRNLANADVAVKRVYSPKRCPVVFDRAQMEQVFLNIVINACHAMPEGGTLTITSEYRQDGGGGDEAVIKISDTGVGIAPEHIGRIFDPFFTTKGPVGGGGISGSGLGLSVSYGLVEAHGGTLAVASEVGQGTTFEVHLPLGDEQSRRSTTGEDGAAGQSSLGQLQGRRVLLAEDDAAVLEALTQLFVALGVKTVAVPDATAATAALDTQFFDVVITDLMMPGGGGRTVVQHVASMGGDRPPVIVMTGRLERALHDEVIAMGAARSIEKPFELRTLLRLVSEVLAAEGH